MLFMVRNRGRKTSISSLKPAQTRSPQDVKVDITLTVPSIQAHETKAELDVCDAPAEWRLEDGKYTILILEWGNHRLRFEIVGGAHDGEQYGIDSDSIQSSPI